jgi:ABC-type multidrug transport system fused ATPase/permease subunit
MTDEEDRRKQKDERRHPSEKDETAMPRRAHDSGRVRKAIRTELEEVAEEGADTQAVSGPKPGRKPQNIVISLENISLSFEEQILNDISFNAHEGETIVVVGESGTGKSTIL